MVYVKVTLIEVLLLGNCLRRWTT